MKEKGTRRQEKRGGKGIGKFPAGTKGKKEEDSISLEQKKRKQGVSAGLSIVQRHKRETRGGKLLAWTAGLSSAIGVGEKK